MGYCCYGEWGCSNSPLPLCVVSQMENFVVPLGMLLVKLSATGFLQEAKLVAKSLLSAASEKGHMEKHQSISLNVQKRVELSYQSAWWSNDQNFKAANVLDILKAVDKTRNLALFSLTRPRNDRPTPYS